jgi:hypothetical protein
MDAVEKLLAIEEIKQLKARYFRFLDTKDYAGLATVFAQDAWFDARNAKRDGNDERTASEMRGDEWFPRGRDNIVAFIRKATEPNRTLHHGHMPEIEILSPTTATGIIAMEDSNHYADAPGASKVHGSFRLHGFGHYHETYSKISGRWVIQTSILTRLRVELS